MTEEKEQRHFDMDEERRKRAGKKPRYLLTGSNFKSVVEELIQDAQERGEFDDLAGAGQPLDLEQNTLAGDMQLAYKMLKDNNFTLPWIEDRKDMLAEIASLREKINYQWQLFGPQVIAMARCGQFGMAQRRWIALLSQWGEAIEELNKRIIDINFQIPVRDLQVMTLGLGIELARVGAAESLEETVAKADAAEEIDQG